MSKTTTHPYVRPSSLRSEHYDDIPKLFSNGGKVNGFEIESLIGSTNGDDTVATVSKLVGSGGLISIANKVIVTIITQSISSLGQSKMRCYILLFLTVVAESYATALSKQSKEIGSTTLFLWSCIVNFFCLVGFNICLAQIEVSVAYAIWSAFGTCLVAIVGIVFFNESCDSLKIFCLGLITAGVVGLNLRDAGGHH